MCKKLLSCTFTLLCTWLLITLVVSAQELENEISDLILYPVNANTNILRSVPEIDDTAVNGDLIVGASIYLSQENGNPFYYYGGYYAFEYVTHHFELGFDTTDIETVDDFQLILTLKDTTINDLGRLHFNFNNASFMFLDEFYDELSSADAITTGTEIVISVNNASISESGMYTIDVGMVTPSGGTIVSANEVRDPIDLDAPVYDGYYVYFYGIDSEFPPRLEIQTTSEPETPEPENPDVILYPESAYTTEIFNFEGVGLTSSFEEVGSDLVASKVHTDSYDEYGSFCTDTTVGHTFQLNFDPDSVSFPVGSAQLVLTLADIHYDSTPLFSELYHEPSWASSDFPTTPNSEIIFEIYSIDDIYAPRGMLLIELACSPVQLRSTNKLSSAAIQWVRFHGMDSEFPPRLEIWEAESVPLAIEMSSTAVSTPPDTQITVLYTIICILTLPILGKLRKTSS